MSSNITTYQINFTTNGDKIFGNIKSSFDGINQSVKETTKVFGECYKALLSVDLVAQNLSQLKASFDNLLTPGASLNSNMLELSAITGVTGDGLKAIEQAARDTAKTFGTSAVDNVEAYKMMLSQLSPEIANNSEAMKMMGENANILSKQMGGDTVAATEVLNTSLNQFGVSMDDPIAAAKIMADMMNVMSAAAQQGSAELPQIKSALEQVGMVAKTTGLSFAETNAYIQLLDQAGKKGSEGGVALRNVLTTLSEGRFTSKLAAEGLEQAGISVDYLADSSIPLHERLKTLRKIQGDTALMTKVFGKENMAAAIAMINTADEAEAMAKSIVGTNSAVEQAEVIMGGYNEKMNRTKAWLDDLKIGFFNLTEPMLPGIQGFFSISAAAGGAAQSYISVKSALEALFPKLFTKTTVTSADTVVTSTNTVAHKQNVIERIRQGMASNIAAIQMRSINLQMGLGAILARIQAGGIRSVAMAFGQATLGATAFQIALDALGIGLILLAVAGLVAGLQHLYHNSRKFREILGGVGGAAKAIFHNIGVYAKRVWDMVLKPIATAYWNLYKWIFTNIWELAKAVWNGISTAISWAWNSVIKPVAGFIYNVYKTAFLLIWNTVKAVFSWIVQLVSKVWNWIKETFGGFASWVEETIIDPIRTMLDFIGKWIDEKFGGLVDKIKNLGQGVKDFFGGIFSSEGTVSVTGAYKKGAEDAGKQFDKEKEDKKKGKGEPQEVKIVDDGHKPIFDVGKNGVTETTTVGGVAAGKVVDNKKHFKAGSDGEGNKVRSLTVGKFAENINIYTHKGTITESKEQILQVLKELFGTAVADYAGV
ncbi:phage tail tape measure protein [Bergeyella zoohelcum]|uniref:Phage tail tape measure protein, TP901 family, core region n=1 Tax=Bergeyella zoohelcum ATCC 43767 TaxID=883096 RepID=K1LQ27_9FLAO|nr:phage tail tape measure protein [Bergeyella zoohelcum]EKB56871.1 phage tail tape measure protein, TP901 family, core region [Bergeyella zoohelcum ATCC 43767]SUV48546.1 Phage-related minor tail protein [Bergeyella zoohelcum]